MNNVTQLHAAPATQPSQKKTIFLALENMRKDLENALPRHLTADRLLQLSYTSLRKNPALLECTPASLVGAVMEAAKLGLEPDVLGTCYLIPYSRKVKNGDSWEKVQEVQLQVGYRGLIELARRSGQITNIVANEVYAGDFFEFEYGLEERLKHIPTMANDRGDIVAFYAYARFREGGHAFVVMSMQEMLQVRNRFAKVNRNTGELYGTWAEHFESMAKKTVIKKLMKFLPLSVELQESLQTDGIIKPGIDADVIEIPAADK